MSDASAAGNRSGKSRLSLVISIFKKVFGSKRSLVRIQSPRPLYLQVITKFSPLKTTQNWAAYISPLLPVNARYFPCVTGKIRELFESRSEPLIFESTYGGIVWVVDPRTFKPVEPEQHWAWDI